MTVSKRLPQSVSGLLGKWPAEETVGVQKLLTRATGPCDESGPPSAYNDPVMRPSVNSFMAGIAQTTSMQHTLECFMGDCGSFVLVLALSCCLVDVQLLGLVGSRSLRPPGRQRLQKITSRTDEHGEDDGDGVHRHAGLVLRLPPCRRPAGATLLLLLLLLLVVSARG